MHDDLCQTACGVHPNFTYNCAIVCLCGVCLDSTLCQEAKKSHLTLNPEMCLNVKNNTRAEVLHSVIICNNFNHTFGNTLCEQRCNSNCHQEQICKQLPNLENCSHLETNSFMLNYQTSNETKQTEFLIGCAIILFGIHAIFN
jgi:hypothetical protein